jgi:membrane-bound lytic murein transglycosylase A
MAKEQVIFSPHSFADLHGWSDEQAIKGLYALRQSCKKPRSAPLQLYDRTVSLALWQRLCREATAPSLSNARHFFETNFDVYRITIPSQQTGLLTGYYTPTLRGSLTKTATHTIPIYAKPHDDVTRTRFTRAQIEGGALNGRGLELIWVDNAIDAFFLHIQGSGYVSLPSGVTKKLVFAAKNDLPYTAIGKQFIAEGTVKPEDMSMQWLRAWLQAHPTQAASVMQRNASFIFFALEETGSGVKGAEGTPLTPQHSVAIDPSYISYGAPLYLQTHFPDGTEYAAMVVAQDTGSAIKGALRADLYTGAGHEAGELAGRLKSDAIFYVFLPKE